MYSSWSLVSYWYLIGLKIKFIINVLTRFVKRKFFVFLFYLDIAGSDTMQQVQGTGVKSNLTFTYKSPIMNIVQYRRRNSI